MIKISDRLKQIIDLIDKNENYTIADIASDYGYVPIYLADNNYCKKIIATDINTNSYNLIKDNINKYLNIDDSAKIDVRLGDGLSVINNNEANVIIISGIGYDLMKSILSNIYNYIFDYMILSPHNKFYEFRKYLHDNNLEIIDEKIVFEDNIYYFIFKIKKSNILIKYDNEYEYMFSKILLDNKNLLLKQYVLKYIKIQNDILKKIDKDNTKYLEIENNIKYANAALNKFNI